MDAAPRVAGPRRGAAERPELLPGQTLGGGDAAAEDLPVRRVASAPPASASDNHQSIHREGNVLIYQMVHKTIVHVGLAAQMMCA